MAKEKPQTPEAHEHTFDTIIGQDLVKRFLLRASDQGRLPHALMFTGPEGVGKRSLAHALAKHLVTRHFAPDDPGIERALGKVARGTHPDVLVVEPRSASGQILKDQIDEMHERAYFAPLEASSKVILIAPIEAMNVTAANNLLKLLEEPPDSLYMLLCTQQMHRTLSTIRSRCALLRCPPVDAATLAEWLTETLGCPQRRARAAAALSGGRPGLATDLASGREQERRKRMVGEVEFFDREGYPAIWRTAHNLIKNSGGAPEVLDDLIGWYRDLFVAALGQEQGAGQSRPLLVNQDLSEEIADVVEKHDARSLGRVLEVLLKHNQDRTRTHLEAHLYIETLLTDVGIALKKS